MTPNDFRRIALSLPGAHESSHMGQPDFRVDNRIFATLASQHLGYGNLMLTPEQQKLFVNDLPEVFLPIPGGWGRMGCTHIILAKAHEDVLRGALQAAHRIRLEKNAKTKYRPKPPKPAAAKSAPRKSRTAKPKPRKKNPRTPA